MEVVCPVCEGPIIFRVFADGDGDPSVPGGTRSWIDAECEQKDCACELTEEQWETLRERAISYDAWIDPDY